MATLEQWGELAHLKLEKCLQLFSIERAIGTWSALQGSIEASAKKEPYLTRHVGRLQDKTRKMVEFTETVSKPSPDLDSKSLMAPIWTIAWGVIHTGLQHREKLAPLIDCLTEILEHVPQIKSCDEALANFPTLQKPLQQIYVSCIDSFMDIVQSIRKYKKLKQEVVKSHSKRSETLFRDAGEEYEKLRTVAQEAARHVAGQYATHRQFVMVTTQPIARGSFGEVFKTEETATGHFYAVKKIASGPGSSQASNEALIQEEIRIMRLLTHHHITTLAFTTKDSDGFNLYIQPYGECDLTHYLYTPQKCGFESSTVYRWFGCLASAIDYAHRKGIRHKDIKPANIILDDKGKRVLLTDFGLAKDAKQTGSDFSTGGVVKGSPKYWAPECTPDGQRDQSVDIFALGCVYAEILHVLLEGSTSKELDKRICDWSKKQEPHFRDCHIQLRAWLNGLDTDDDEIKEFLIAKVKEMVNVKGVRPKTTILYETIRNKSGRLCCESCPH